MANILMNLVWEKKTIPNAENLNRVKLKLNSKITQIFFLEILCNNCQRILDNVNFGSCWINFG